MSRIDAETGYQPDTATARFQSTPTDDEQPSRPMTNSVRTAGLLILGFIGGFLFQDMVSSSCPNAELIRAIRAETLAMIRYEHARREFEEQDRGLIIGPYRPGASGFY